MKWPDAAKGKKNSTLGVGGTAGYSNLVNNEKCKKITKHKTQNENTKRKLNTASPYFYILCSTKNNHHAKKYFEISLTQP